MVNLLFKCLNMLFSKVVVFIWEGFGNHLSLKNPKKLRVTVIS